MPAKYKVAYLVSHPIQYQAPLLRYLSSYSSVDLTTHFLSDFSLREYHDPNFKSVVKWDIPLLDGYKHVFLHAWGRADKLTPLRPFSIGLLKHLRAGKYDALWVHGYAHQVNIRSILIAKLLGIKVFVRADAQMASAQGAGLKRKVKEAALRRLFALIDGFLAVGSLNRDYYCYYGVPTHKIFIMPYAVDNEFFQSKAQEAQIQRPQLRELLGLDSERPVILFASRIVKRKRAEDLIDAYAALSCDGKQEPRPYLLFVGEGEHKEAAEAYAHKLGWSSIKFLGFKNQTELPRYYDLCDVFVLAADKEPWGLVVNEVMNAGKPIILSNEVGAAADLVRHGENGFTVPVGDVHALTEKLAQITSQPGLAQQMGDRSLAIINEWSFAENARVLEQALQTIVGETNL